MDIQLNLTTPQAENITLDEVIFSQATTELSFSVTPSDKTLVDGLSCALLTPQGKTLAHALTNANKAILDTSTIECYEYVQGLPIEGAKDAYIVIGESTKPLAIVSVQVAKNYLADIAPPSATAPVYPTSQELQAILARLTEIETNVNADKDVVTSLVEGFDEEVTKGVNQVNTATTDGVESINALVDGFDTTVQEAVTQVNQATNSGTEAINFTTQQGATYIDSITNQGTTTITNATNTATTAITNATNQATTSIDDKVDAFNTILEQDKQEIADAVIEAEGARDEAETAKNEAESARDEAVIALNNGCVYTPNIEGISNSDNIAYITNGERTIYRKLLDVGNFSYTIVPSVNFDVEAYQVIVIWAWLSIACDADKDPQEIIIPNNVQFIGSTPSFAVGSECMLALMSTDKGATWIANTQWEKQDGVLV